MKFRILFEYYSHHKRSGVSTVSQASRIGSEPVLPGFLAKNQPGRACWAWLAGVKAPDQLPTTFSDDDYNPEAKIMAIDADDSESGAAKIYLMDERLVEGQVTARGRRLNPGIEHANSKG